LPPGRKHRFSETNLFPVAFGLVGVGFVAGLSGFHDAVAFGNILTVGTRLPPTPFFYVFLVGVVWNGPVVRRRARHAGGPADEAVRPGSAISIR
jgi:hypothetical protein